jgi:hypothetical protein
MKEGKGWVSWAKCDPTLFFFIIHKCSNEYSKIYTSVCSEFWSEREITFRAQLCKLMIRELNTKPVQMKWEITTL